ncbi:hypothetical protein EVAR_2613_1 [Eumeta japonica]|uniref:Histone-lysine N-methyltransferase SETMAR n=1 Tax=Eumeta variegata TaxID=151549 RepID=A0A4C1SQ34_EUMVA|nr:hypothetical protein EVAR_2613_1 [Eumeta japonica]
MLRKADGQDLEMKRRHISRQPPELKKMFKQLKNDSTDGRIAHVELDRELGIGSATMQTIIHNFLFSSSNFDIKDKPRSGRLEADKTDIILEKLDKGRHIRSYNIAEELGIDHKIVLTHLKKARYLGPPRAH